MRGRIWAVLFVIFGILGNSFCQNGGTRFRGTLSSDNLRTGEINADSINVTDSISCTEVETEDLVAETVHASRIQGSRNGDPIILNGEVIITN
ncbi:unnamed protein product [Moneuplotes crassus]|uniref:DUF5666 domain-containing protein n=1 Tax=Euplotes crassus TaxID=5936 RepID=A0AAD2D8V2_EUPCR|nr:unnamed protein product [Moneuplotes crassus]